MSPESAGRILREQGMPPEQVHAVLARRDPVLARRVFELHRERLGERLEEQRRLVERIERGLGRGVSARPPSVVRQQSPDRIVIDR
jgi:hypothetical protein